MMNIRKIERGEEWRCIELMKIVLMDFMDDVRSAITKEEETTLWETYNAKGAALFVFTFDDLIVGTVAIRPIDVDGKKLCEMQRLFLMPETRGNGYGGKLYATAEDFAKSEGYEGIYLETLSEMYEANVLYSLNGYQNLDQPLIDSGKSCHKYMVKYFD